MSQNIYKHRRGTTQEWLEVDLIPEEGELVIEECSNGLFKCKIGDGVSKFSLLPYIDEALQVELLEKIIKITDDFNDSLTNITQKTKTDLDETTRMLSEADSLLADRLTTDFIAADNTIIKQLSKKLEDAVMATEEAFTDKLTDLETGTSDKINTLEKKLITEIDKVAESTDSTIATKINNLETVISATNNNIENLSAGLTAEQITRKNQVLELDAKLEKITKDVEDSAISVDNKLEGAIHNTNSAINDLTAKLTSEQNSRINQISDLDAEIKKVSKDISDSVASVTRELSNSIYTIDSNIDDLTTNLATEQSIRENQVSELNTEISKLVTSLSEEQNVREEQVSELTVKIDNATAEIKNSLKPELQRITVKLDSKLSELSDEHEIDIESLREETAISIKQLDETFQKHVESSAKQLAKLADKTATDLNTKIDSLQNAIKIDIESLNKKQLDALDNVKFDLEQSIAAGDTELQEKLNQFKVELTSVDINLDKTIQQLESFSIQLTEALAERIDILGKKTEQLNNNDLKLFNKIESVNNDVNNFTAELTNAINSLKKQQIDCYAFIEHKFNLLAEEYEVTQASELNTFFNYITHIYIELADLVDDDILILERVFAVDNKLHNLINEVDEKLSTRIDTVENRFTTELHDIQTALVANLNKINEDLVENLLETKNSLLENIETLRSTSNIKINENLRAIEELQLTVLDNHTITLNRFKDVEASINRTIAETDQKIFAINQDFDKINERIDTTNKKLDAQVARVSNFIARPEGSLPEDAELIDIRNGYNGLYYDCAGDAVRAIGYDLDDLKTRLPDYIPSNAVDGLLYEDNLLYLTSKGVPVSDPVEITGGSGGGGSYSTVRVVNNLISNSFTIAKDSPAWIDFTYTSFENDVPTGDGTVNIFINSKKIDEISGNIQHGVAKRLDVSSYLKNGANDIKITCTDQYGASRSLVYTISVVELRIESTFDSTRIFNDSITFRYKVFGQVEKTVHVLVDGNEISNRKLSASVSGNESTLLIPNQTHGCHKITAYITALIGNEDIQSNIIEYEILCVEDNKNDAMLASIFSQTTATQGDLISIPYLIYDPTRINADIDLIIYSQVGGQLIEINRSTVTASRELQYWNTRQYPVGQIIFTISYTYNLYGVTTTISKSHTVNVEALKIDISAEEDSLQLFLSAQGRSNNEPETNRASWNYKPANSNEPLITTNFENFNWSSNGWVIDNNGDTCLRLNGDAKATINFKPFAKDFKLDGKTIEFEFCVRDVNSRNAVVIDCYDGTRGFQATPDTAFLQSSGTKVSCRYKDEEKVRVAIAVEYADSLSRFVSIYLDGILSGVQRYTTTDNFAQDNPLNITLGSPLCGLDIYNIRVYDKALSTQQILTNYIADIAEPNTKLQLITDNDILDENGKISYERVKALGQVPIITFTGPMPTYKGDKKKGTTRMKFEDPLHPELNFDVLLSQIDVQGTSSQFYVRKNWKVTLPEKKVHMPGAIPAKVFCIKVDYAEATGTHNTGSANYIETLYDRNEALLPPQKDDDRVRTTIQGFPCILFEKATEDSEPVFSSKANFNYDKGAEDTFGFTDAYKAFGVECWEFCNNTSDAVNFVGEISPNWLEDFEPRYVPASANFDRIEELQEIAEQAASGKGIMTEAQRQELQRLLDDCIANFKTMHDWVLSTATYTLSDGKRIPITPKPLATPVTYGETTYTEDTEEYRLAKFKYEFKDYFNMHYSSMYYVFTLFALMTDQRAKNLFLTRWRDDDGVYRWYPYFYDNDTIFGINNEGALVFDYYHEDTDQLGSSNVFNGQNSVLWNNFRTCFQQEIQNTYAALRSNNKLTYDAIMDTYITQGSDKWSATIYNEDAEYKYISMARQVTDGTDVDASNLYQVRGPGEHHLRYFVSNRLNYCDGKWYAGNYPDDYIFLRIYTPTTAAIPDDASEEQIAAIKESNARIQASLDVVKADPSITVTPFSDMYAGVRYKSGTLQQKRLSAGESYKFTPLDPNETFGDTEAAIYGASELSSLGDLSGLYCGVISLGKASKLTTLKIGHESPYYHNDNFREISVGSNRLLRTIDLRNCSGLGIAGQTPQKTLDLSGCPNIEHIYTEGTNLDSVELPESGYIKTLHLPSSTKTLVVKNQHNIEDFKIGDNTSEDYKNIKTLCVENSTLDTDAILANCQIDGKFTVERVRLTGINWSFDNTDFIKSLYPKFDTEGNIIGGIRGIDERNNNIDDAYLVGTCYIKELTGAEYTEIKSHYPYLDIEFGTMTSNVIFKYTDDAGAEYTHTVSITGKDSALGVCSEPVLDPKPAWAENDAFTYEQVGWSRLKQESKGLNDTEEDYKDFVHLDALLNIAGDRILYPVFKAVRKSYPVRFINPTSIINDGLLQTVLTPYGSSAVYDGDEPKKLDAASPELYAFTSWYPKPENITGPMDCLAQFSVLDSTWYTIGLTDITDCTDYNGNIYDGYELNKAKETMTITKCKNKWNPAVLIPSVFTLDSGAYTVNKIGGFDEHTQMELIKLPETTEEISARGFYNCYSLFELTLPDNLVTIGMSAFQNCSKIKTLFIPKNVTNIGEAAFADCRALTTIEVDADNPRYVVVNNCLIDNRDRKLMQGLTTGEIPLDGSVTSLGTYCFSNTGIISATIPDNIRNIPNNAFSRCYNLVSVKLPDSGLESLDATCFAWCNNLTDINLPEGLKYIYTYVFDSCALSNVTIPSTVDYVLERSFGDMPTLKEVTFKKRTNTDGTIFIPEIHSKAFVNSGSTTEPLVFNVPWSAEDTPDAPWGAVNATVNFNYNEEVI